MKRTVLYKNSCDRTAAAVELCFYYKTLCASVRICFKLFYFCDKKYGFEKVGNSLSCKSRYGNAYNVSAPFFGNEVVLCKFRLYRVYISRGLIYFIYRNDDGNARCLCVVYSLYRLGHDSVVSRNYDYGNIRRLGASCTHCRKSFMSRGVEECYVFSVEVYSVSAYMLCYTAGFSRSYTRMTYSVEKRCLTVVNVTHNAYDGASCYEVFLFVCLFVEEFILYCNNNFLRYDSAHLVCDKISGIIVYYLVYRRHNAHHHELFDNFSRGDFHKPCKFSYRYFVGNGDLYRLRLFVLVVFLCVHHRNVTAFSLCIRIVVLLFFKFLSVRSHVIPSG